MNDLQKQIRLAQRRLLIQEFLSIVPWTLFGSLCCWPPGPSDSRS